MKKLFIIGNWKSYKTAAETTAWFQDLGSKNQELGIEDKEIILCVPFTVLSLAKSLIKQYDLPIKLGTQDISPFDEGKYTGEINGKQIAEFAEYVIIGHSERRENFSETNEIINQKIDQAFAHDLKPILCVSEISQMQSVPPKRDPALVVTKIKMQKNNANSTMIIAYEPLFAIGSGHPDSPENAEKTISEIKKETEEIPVIYGGSVTSENVHTFTSMPSISGVLLGGASLSSQEFTQIIINA